MASENMISTVISAASASTLWEAVRRWSLVLGLFLAVIFFTWTDFRPYFSVMILSEPEFAEFQKRDLSESGPGESDNPDSLLGGELQPKVKVPLVMVDGPEWQRWFALVQSSLHGGHVPAAWLHRLTKDDAREVKRFAAGKTSFEPDVRRLVFGRNEAPLAPLFAGRKAGEDLIVGFKNEAGSASYAKVYYSEAPYLKGLASGIYGVPEAFSYPLRALWYVPLVMMMALYVFLPWPAAGANVCAYKRWQVVLGDFAGCLLYGVFMALPLLIVGGAVQALTEWFLFTAIFWGLAALGLCCIWWSYFYSVYRIFLFDDQLIFACPKAVKSVPFDKITSIEAVRVVPPRWLVVLSLLAALGGRGQAGRAMLLSSNSAEGICVGTADGEAVYVWTTNSIGQESLTHLDLLIEKLMTAPAQELPDIRQLEAIFPPIIEPLSQRKTSKVIKRESGAESLLQEASRLLKERALAAQ